MIDVDHVYEAQEVVVFQVLLCHAYLAIGTIASVDLLVALQCGLYSFLDPLACDVIKDSLVVAISRRGASLADFADSFR